MAEPSTLPARPDETARPRILYLVHDLSDPAVRRRVTMLDAGGAAVRVAGFRREGRPAEPMPGAGVPIDLGSTRDGQFVQRIAAVMAAGVGIRGALQDIQTPDVIIARNLEMLAMADRLARTFMPRPAIVYECLDIHRLLLGRNAVGSLLRGTERHLARRAALLMTSSPAFLREYFQRFGQIDAPVELVENKVLDIEPFIAATTGPPPPADGEPWVIGWFGALRCLRSLDLLASLTRKLDGRVRVLMRGRPAYAEIPDFDERVAREPHMKFDGAYRYPEDLSEMYGSVHFTWAIDYFEAGMNSEWLLPNRLYEGGAHHAVPIAREGTETARFLAERGLGLVLTACTPEALAAVFANLGPADYAALRARMEAMPDITWRYGIEDCRALVARLAALAPAGARLEAAA